MLTDDASEEGCDRCGVKQPFRSPFLVMADAWYACVRAETRSSLLRRIM